MKVALVFLALVPIALCVPVEKRSFPNLLDLEYAKHKLQEMLDHLGSDESLVRCQTVCHNVFTVDESHLIHVTCTPICRSFQYLVNLFHLHPRSTTTTVPPTPL